MNDAQISNLLGVLSLTLADAQAKDIRHTAGLAPSACAAIVTVGQYPGNTIAALSEVLGLTHSVTVRLAEGLVAAGLVERLPCADKRQVALRLTPKGRRTRRAILRARQQALAVALSALSAADRQHFGRAVAAILTKLTRDRREADHMCRLCDEGACPGDTCPVELQAVRLERGIR